MHTLGTDDSLAVTRFCFEVFCVLFVLDSYSYKLIFMPFPLLDTSLGKVNFLFFRVQSTIQIDIKRTWKAVQSGIQFIIKNLKIVSIRVEIFNLLLYTEHDLSFVGLKHPVAWSRDPLCLSHKGSPEQCRKKEFLFGSAMNRKLWALALAHICGIGRAGEILSRCHQGIWPCV